MESIHFNKEYEEEYKEQFRNMTDEQIEYHIGLEKVRNVIEGFDENYGIDKIRNIVKEIKKEKEKQEDILKAKKFIENNPYPKYDKVINIMKNDGILKNDFMDMFSEYGTPNHEWMKEIYENILDKNIVRKNGEMIYKRGNLFTMQMNYYTFICVVKYFLEKSNLDEDEQMFIHYNFKDLLSNYWDGIGGWRHWWFFIIS